MHREAIISLAAAVIGGLFIGFVASQLIPLPWGLLALPIAGYWGYWTSVNRTLITTYWDKLWQRK